MPFSIATILAVQFSNVKIAKWINIGGIIQQQSLGLCPISHLSTINKDQAGCQEMFPTLLLTMNWRSVKQSDQQTISKLTMQSYNFCALSAIHTVSKTHISYHGSCFSKITSELVSASYHMNVRYMTQPETSTSSTHERFPSFHFCLLTEDFYMRFQIFLCSYFTIFQPPWRIVSLYFRLWLQLINDFICFGDWLIRAFMGFIIFSVWLLYIIIKHFKH